MKHIFLKIGSLIIALIFILNFSKICFAVESNANFSNYTPKLDESQSNELKNSIDEETKKNIEQIGINSPDVSQMKNFSIENFFKFIIEKSIQTLKQPIFILVNCLAVILIASLFENVKPHENLGDLNTILGLVTTLCSCAVIVAPIIDCITAVSKTINNFQNFMLCFIPVFTGTLTMNLKTATSIGYSSTLFFIAQTVSMIISNFLLPITGCFLALSIVGGLNSNFQISELTSLAKKVVIFILIFMVTVFIGLFSLQTSITVSSDAIAIKAAKFVSNSFIPIIGSALGDALGSVVGGLNVIKSTVGGFGILVCLASFIPSILKIGFFLMAITLISSLAKSFKINLVEQTMSSTKDCLSILLSFLISYGMLIITTTSIIVNLTSK